MTFTTILSEGNLISADLLEQIATGEASGQRPEDFGLEKTRRLIDEIAAAWSDAREFWSLFQRRLETLARQGRLRADDPGHLAHARVLGRAAAGDAGTTSAAP